MKPNRENRSMKGFTLIELLIVVAIIAILAAIAVPNFLQAQTRSKVARVKADMRSVATAIEEYTVDWNVVPPGWREHWDRPPWNNALQCNIPDRYEANKMAFARMTTPEGYISSIPNDPFQTKVVKTQTGVSHVGPFPFNYDTYAPFGRYSAAGNFAEAKEKAGYTWCLNSPGPTCKDENSARILLGTADTTKPNKGHYIYDASNGTVSNGLIMRTNKGIPTGPGT